MKISYLLLIFLFGFHILNAQKKASNEFGLGIGTIQLNPNGESYLFKFEPKWTYQTVFKQNGYKNYMLGVTKISNRQSFSSPILYFSNHPSRRSTLRASFQFAKDQGEVNGLLSNEFGDPGIFKYNQKVYQTTFGYGCNFLLQHKIQCYVATDIEIDYQIVKENEISYFGAECVFYQWVNEGNRIQRSSIRFGLNQILGIKLPISNQLSIRYECSGKFVESEVRLRPLNRLSLDILL